MVAFFFTANLLKFLANNVESSGKPLNKYEPTHDKTNNVAVHPGKSVLCAQSVVKDPSFFHVDSEDSDQTGRTCHFVGFVMKRLK